MNAKWNKTVWLALAVGAQAFAAESDPCAQGCCEDPWFTGPLLTPSPTTVPFGHMNIEPYLYVRETLGIYDAHWKVQASSHTFSWNFQLPIQTGLCDWADLTVTPQAYYNHYHGAHATRFGDLGVQVSFQLFAKEDGTKLKLSINEMFPTGKFQRLNPNKEGTDVSGGGSYATTIGLTFGQIFQLYDCHFLNTRYNLSWTIPSPASVHGLNAYGGGDGTIGTVYPGNIGTAMVGLEYSLTQKWALACDVMGIVGAHNRFSGNPGTNPDATPATVGGSSYSQFSLAPAIEYNISENAGWIGGVWFSVAGRNTTDFVCGVLAFNYFY